MSKISKEIFSPYLEKNSLRPMFENPFPCGDYVVATDTKALLMIRKDLLEDSFVEVKHTPNVMKLLSEQNCEYIIDRKTITSALNGLPHEKEMEEVEQVYSSMTCVYGRHSLKNF